MMARVFCRICTAFFSASSSELSPCQFMTMVMWTHTLIDSSEQQQHTTHNTPHTNSAKCHEVCTGLPCGQNLIRTISCVLGIIQKIRIRNLSSWKQFPNNNSNFWRVRSSFAHSVTLLTCTLWPLFTHVLIRCRHWKEKRESNNTTTTAHIQTHITDRHTQTTHTAQTHHISIPFVVVFLMMHGNIYVYIYVHVHVYGYLDLWIYGYGHVYVHACVCVFDMT